MYSKIQLNTANAIKVIASETVPIPDPNSYVAQQSAAGAGDASTQDKFSDAGASFEGNVVVGAIIYDSTDVRAYRVTKVDSDKEMSDTQTINRSTAKDNYNSLIYTSADKDEGKG